MVCAARRRSEQSYARTEEALVKQVMLDCRLIIQMAFRVRPSG